MKSSKPKKSLKKRLLWYLYILLLILPCLELCLWLVGGRPYYEEYYKIEVSPENAFVGDSEYGIALNPGTYEITLNDKLTFAATHLSNRQRKVCFQEDLDNLTDRAVVMGCSYTYGYGVNDDQHFTSLLQREFKGLKFENWGTIGFGTVQSSMQLAEMIDQREEPDRLLLTFSSAHLDRNVMSPIYRRAMGIGFKRSMNENPQKMEEASFPYVELNEANELSWRTVKWKEMYSDWWGRSFSASINWLQTQIDIYKRHRQKVVEASFQILDLMDSECREYGIEFTLLILDRNEEVDELCVLLKEANIKFHLIDFDFGDENLTNAPADEHPNAKGHQYIADKISAILEP